MLTPLTLRPHTVVVGRDRQSWLAHITLILRKFLDARVKPEHDIT
jgi:hypothetical protein